jgi:hypothetical protein
MSTIDEMIEKANDLQGVGEYWLAEKLESNHAERGPNNLLRHQIGEGCIGHGAGTWDLIEGGFS